MEQENINETQEANQEKKSPKGFASLLGKMDAAGETGLKKVLFNMPFVLFLVVLAALHIANNHMAETYARNITKTEREVKQLRWQYMTTTSSLMQKSKQSEVAKLVNTQGLKELRIPPYKIEVKE
ncbi:MAG: FtsL-like putative cell division protein [Bacteroidetes bacterium]|nr:FtsL-like putative cell division protein [Bacteroidota bacterium]